MFENEGSTEIDWEVPRARTARARVVAHTDGHKAVSYELCAAAGLMFVRRTIRRGERVVVHESTWSHTRDARRLWARILSCEAG